MTLNKTNFTRLQEMISNNDSINFVKAFCKGLGFDTDSFSSPVTITSDKITITYRRENSCLNFNHSAVHGTTYFGKLK